MAVYNANNQIGTVYVGSNQVYSAEEVVRLEITGQAYSGGNEQYNTYEKTYTVPAGVTKATITEFYIYENVYGVARGYLYFNNNTLIGSKESHYNGVTNNLYNNITVPQTLNVKAGDVFKVVATGWTNNNVFSGLLYCTTGVYITFE